MHLCYIFLASFSCEAFEKLWNSGYNKVIVSFDLRDEVFGQMALPDSCAIGDGIIWKLLVLKGSLSAIVYSKPKEIDNCFEIWVMIKYGVQESWTKLYTIRPFSSVVPVGSWKNGEVIFIDRNESSHKLFSYDPDTQKSVYFKIPPNMGSVSVLNYVESLESIEGGTQRSSRRCSFMTGTHGFFFFFCVSLAYDRFYYTYTRMR